MALSRSLAQAVGLILVGLLLTVIGASIWGFCATLAPVNGVAPDCGAAPAVLTVFGVLILIAGIAVGVASAYSGPRTIYPSTDPAVPPPVIQPVVVQQTIVQQTVEVRCRYCGSLNPVTATKCVACGAAL